MGKSKENEHRTIEHLIQDFEQRNHMARNDFVIVVAPECSLIRSTVLVIGGVEVVRHEDLHETALGIIAREHLDELEDIIKEMGLDQDFEFPEDIDDDFVEIMLDYDDDDDDDDPEPIEMVICSVCAHPISVFCSEDLLAVTCPWCNSKTEIDE